MSKNIKSFLSNINLIELDNWSVQYLFNTSFSYNDNYKLVKIGSFLRRNKTNIYILDNNSYKRVTIKINNGGIFLRDIKKGINIGTKKQFLIKEGQFIVSKIDARNGAFGVIPTELDDAIITGNFWTFDVDYSLINPHFLSLITTTKEFILFCSNASNGTTNRHYLQEEAFLNVKIPLPSLEEQNILLEKYNDKILLAQKQEIEAKEIEDSIEEYLLEELGIEKIESKVKSSKLQFIESRTVFEWGVDKIVSVSNFKSDKYNISSLQSNEKLYIDLFRGKSPKYSNDSNAIILNQKCNRWNDIALEYVKTVDKNWLKNINIDFFTQENDILINSTGEGTIGRATSITKEYENYLYDSHLLLLRLNQEQVNSQYYVYLFNSIYGQQQVENIKSAQATKQTELGIANLKKISFPLPPIDIQLKIVEEINIRTKQIKQLKQEAISNRENAIKEFENEIFNEA